MKLTAVYKSYLWAGDALRRLFNKPVPEDTAESWELSCRQDSECSVANGEWAGRTLSEFVRAKGKNVVGSRWSGGAFPLLIKLLDTGKDLSVQVHPGDEYARKNERESGKTEMWYVLNCEEGARLMMGFDRDVTRAEIRQRVKDGTLLEILHSVPVKKGDSFLIEAGLVHAVGKGLVIAEIQQNSDVTYRLFDYNRKDRNGNLRPLHIEKALDVIRTSAWSSSPVLSGSVLSKHDLPPERNTGSFRIKTLAHCDYFHVDFVSTEANAEVFVGPESFIAVVGVSGRFTVKCAGGSAGFAACQTVFLPADSARCEFTGTGEFLLASL